MTSSRSGTPQPATFRKGERLLLTSSNLRSSQPSFLRDEIRSLSSSIRSSDSSLYTVGKGKPGWTALTGSATVRQVPAAAKQAPVTAKQAPVTAKQATTTAKQAPAVAKQVPAAAKQVHVTAKRFFPGKMGLTKRPTAAAYTPQSPTVPCAVTMPQPQSGRASANPNRGRPTSGLMASQNTPDARSLNIMTGVRPNTSSLMPSQSYNSYSSDLSDRPGWDDRYNDIYDSWEWRYMNRSGRASPMPASKVSSTTGVVCTSYSYGCIRHSSSLLANNSKTHVWQCIGMVYQYE